MRRLWAFLLAAPVLGGFALLTIAVVAISAIGVVLGGGDSENGESGNCDVRANPELSAPSENALADIPKEYLDLYLAAARSHEGFDWAYLAAIGAQESNHGRNPAAFRPEGSAGSDAPGRAMRGGAQGPMQFMPATWVAYGQDYSGDGQIDVYDPADAIPAAADYLVAHGAPEDWDRAILGYIGPTGGWYVKEVKDRAEEYRGAAAQDPAAVPSAGPSLVAPPSAPTEGGGTAGGKHDRPMDGKGAASGKAAGLYDTCAGAEPEALGGGAVVTNGTLTVSAPSGTFNGPLPVGALGEAMKVFASKMGTEYVWGATGPWVFDCSGLVFYSLSQAGFPDGRMTAAGYESAYPEIASGQEQPGDLVLFRGWRNDGAAGHIGMVLNPSEKTMMHTYTSGKPATVSHYDTWDGGPIGFVRVPPIEGSADTTDDPGVLIVGAGTG